VPLIQAEEGNMVPLSADLLKLTNQEGLNSMDGEPSAKGEDIDESSPACLGFIMDVELLRLYAKTLSADRLNLLRRRKILEGLAVQPLNEETEDVGWDISHVAWHNLLIGTVLARESCAQDGRVVSRDFSVLNAP